jgi:hypothetical protein
MTQSSSHARARAANHKWAAADDAFAAFAAAAAVAASAAQDDVALVTAHAMDLLQLAVNCSNTTTAEMAFGHLQDVVVVDAAAAGRLMVTAAARGHLWLVAQMTALPAVQQKVPAAALSIVLEHLLLGDEGELRSRHFALIVVADMIAEQQLPSQQIDISTLVRLLRAVIKSQDGDVACDFTVQLNKLVRDDSRQQLLLAAVEACAGIGRDSLATRMATVICPF